MTFEWQAEALEEYVESAGYYEEQQEGLGSRFIERVEFALARMLRNPVTYRVFERGCRKIRIEPFPYALVYRVADEHIVIVAVMNQHREPGYWHRRLDR